MRLLALAGDIDALIAQIRLVAPLSAILLRLVWLLTELLVSSILYLGMGRRRPP